MDKNIKISIILPTCNGSRYIEKAVDSVLNQSFKDWELLIIDDGSEDNTEGILKKYIENNTNNIYLKNKTNLGIQKSLNRGLTESHGDYIARIDDDDVWIDKDKLKKQIEFLDNNKDYVLVGTGVVVVDDDGKEKFRYLLPQKDIEIRNVILLKNCFVHSCVIFKKDAVLNFSGYSESIETKHIEDYDLWLKLGLVGKFANLPFYGTNFMIRKESVSSSNKLEQLKKDMVIIRKFGNNYPRYFKAFILGSLRLFFYQIYNIFPNQIKITIFKLYKEF